MDNLNDFKKIENNVKLQIRTLYINTFSSNIDVT